MTWKKIMNFTKFVIKNNFNKSYPKQALKFSFVVAKFVNHLWEKQVVLLSRFKWFGISLEKN